MINLARPRACAAVVAAAAAIACGTDADEGGFGLEATGAVEAVSWLDRNGNGEVDGADAAVGDVRIALLPPAGSQELYSTSTGSDGLGLIPSVMVGDYRAVVDSASVGDSLRILRVDSADVTVSSGDTALVVVAVTYPSVPTDTARRMPLDRRLFIEGLALGAWSTFGDGSIHVRDSTGALRVARAQAAAVVPGDSVRILGRTARQSGQPVLNDGVVFLLRGGLESPPARSTSTAEAAAAADGLDADLVRVEAAVQDTSRNAFGELVFTLDDGSGPVDVVLDRDVPFLIRFPAPLSGATMQAAGLLIPAGAGGPWVVKPRGQQDIGFEP